MRLRARVQAQVPALIVLAIASVSIPPGRAVADDEGVPIQDPDTFQEDVGALPRMALQPEWSLYGFGWDDGHIVSSAGGGFNVAWSTQEPTSFQILNLYVGFLFGSFGDERHRFGHLQLGYKPRLQLFEGGLLGIYAAPRLVYTLSELREEESNSAHSLSMGGGFGVSVADGLIAGEFAVDAAYALSDEFRPSGSTPGEGTLWKPRVTFNLLFDVCWLLGQRGQDSSACRYAPATTRSVDLTQVLMARVRLLDTDEDRAALCKAADRGVSVAAQPDAAECSGFETDGFLCRVGRDLAGTAYQDRVTEAVRTHHALAACYRQNRVDALLAARNDWLLRTKLQYGASPPELRRAMRCEDGADRLPSLREPSVRDALVAACEACPLACKNLPTED